MKEQCCNIKQSLVLIKSNQTVVESHFQLQQLFDNQNNFKKSTIISHALYTVQGRRTLPKPGWASSN